MQYICEACGFVFFRRGEVEECPVCEKKCIRVALEEELEKQNN